MKPAAYCSGFFLFLGITWRVFRKNQGEKHLDCGGKDMKGYRLLSAALLVAFAILFVWTVGERDGKDRAEIGLENAYQQSFFTLGEHAEQIEVLLGKSLVTASPGQTVMLLTGVWHHTEGAQQSLAQLPLGQLDLSRTQRFYAQTGDYCKVLAQKATQGKPITDEEWQQLSELYAQATKISQELQKMQQDITRGQLLNLTNERRSWRNILGSLGIMPVAQTNTDQISEGFQAIDGLLQGIPTLLYDGPFSDHIERREPRGLKGENISEEQAKGIANAFIDNSREIGYQIKEEGMSTGPIPAYSFTLTATGQGVGEISIDVSQQGGHVLWYWNTRSVQEPSLDVSSALVRAEEFLNSRGFRDLTVTGSLRQGNEITFAFVHEEDGIIIYPDMQKVTVALDDGQVIGYEAVGYYMSHHKRNLPEPELSEEDARLIVNPRLEISRVRLTLIPTPAQEEVLAYEIRAKLGQQEFLIYINAKTGVEELIQQIIETDDGTLTM